MTRPSVRAKQTLVMRMEVARRVHTSEEEDTVPLVIDAERLRAKGCAVPMMLIRMGKRLPDHDRGAIGPLPQKKAYPNTVHPLHWMTSRRNLELQTISNFPFFVSMDLGCDD